MKELFLDIETLPAPPELVPLLREQYSKIPDRPTTFEDYHRRTSLNGTLGQIFCIALAVNDEPTTLLQGLEPEILQGFWRIAGSVDRFIGHSILDFDLPFILKRSIIHRIKPSRQLSFARYRSDPIYDTKKEWDNWGTGPSSSLDTLAKVFGYPTSKQGIDGSHVYDFWLAKRYDEIYAYCQRDVELTRLIYRRMTFSEIDQEAR